jgi:hypothetical protein
MLAARQAIVDALATIPGVSATPAMPDTPVAGAAWPVWSASSFSGGKMSNPITHTYNVVMVLPAGYLPDTVDASDGVVEQVMTALQKVGVVQDVTPGTVTFVDPEQTSMPGINARVTVSTC